MSKFPKWAGRGNVRALALSTGLLAVVLGSSLAVAAGEGDPLRGGERNPGKNQSRELTRETQIIAQTNTYGTRQSNKSDNGGGAIYGCRSRAGGTPAGNEPCIRANNLADGLAFEFEGGPVVGRIDGPDGGGDDTKPFTTNATGVATGLNADEVDGQSAEEIRDAAVAQAATNAGRQATRWALVNEDGQIARQTGGFTLTNCYQANDNCYIDAGEDVRNNGIHAQIVVQNTDGIPDETELSGETGTAPCGADFVNCAPPGTEDNEVIVVAPRDSDGSAKDGDNRFRFYVFVTGTEG